MHANKWALLLLVMLLLISITPAQAASPVSSAAFQPWKIQLLKGDVGNVVNMSAAFVGQTEIPMISYSITGSTRIYRTFRATPAVTGNCGINNSWYCTYTQYDNLIPGSLSQMAVEQTTANTFTVGWAYSTGTMVHVVTIEFNNNMTLVGSPQEDVMQIGKFGASIVGAPSLQFDHGDYLIALTVEGSDDFYTQRLVFINYRTIKSQTCLNIDSNYYCSVVDQSIGMNSMGAPSFQLDSDSYAGIAYYKAGADFGLMFAYPHMDNPSVPHNCSTGILNWRCISILGDAGTTTIGREVRISRRAASGLQTAIAFTLQNSTGNILMHATFVGSGGNCGDDLDYLGGHELKWECHLPPSTKLLSTRSFSIAIDPLGYSVIAYEDALSDPSPVDLYLTYPPERKGGSGFDWPEQYIDGAPVTEVVTGGRAAIALNSQGFGFIAYLQAEDYGAADLKIAWQFSRIYLPLLRR